MRSFLEEKLEAEGWGLPDTVLTIQHGLLKDIPIRLSASVPEDTIFLHPFVLGKILANGDLNEIVDVIKRKG
jgi:hypothetical protein